MNLTRSSRYLYFTTRSGLRTLMYPHTVFCGNIMVRNEVPIQRSLTDLLMVSELSCSLDKHWLPLNGFNNKPPANKTLDEATRLLSWTYEQDELHNEGVSYVFGATQIDYYRLDKPGEGSRRVITESGRQSHISTREYPRRFPPSSPAQPE